MKKQISYHYRLYLEVSCVIFILMLVIGVFFYKHDTTLMRDSVEENTVEALSTLHTRVDDRLVSLDGAAKKIQASEELLEIVSSITEEEENYFQKYPRIKESVNQLILQNLVSEELDTSAHFISKYMDTIGVYMKVEPYNRLSVTKDVLKSDEKLEEYLNTDEYVLYEAPCQSKWYSQENIVFSIIRPIRDNFETYGVLEISQTMKEMDEILTLDEFPDTYEVMIWDEDGNSCYTFGDGSLDIDEDKLSFSKLTDGDVQYLDEEFLLCSHKSKLTGWTMVMIRRMDGLKGQLYSFLKLLLSVFALIFGAVLLFLYLITKSLTRPLRSLKDKLCMVEMDEEIHLDIQTESNEVTALAIGIEEFLNQIRDQNRHMIEIRKRALKAQLDRMEAQMNPHFLYNALAVIGACGQEDGSDRVYKMSCGLADLLRYSIKYEHSQVEFRDEIRNVKNYLLIMGLRYEDQVQVEWELNETLMHVMVPKLSFQPVLENCFKHGFKSRRKIWKIKIHTMRIENQWRFIVKNNGEPFTDERIEAIRGKYRAFVTNFMNGDDKREDDEPAGLGLENTLKRLFIQYGDGAFWNIHTEGEWTIVEIGGEISEKNAGLDR